MLATPSPYCRQVVDGLSSVDFGLAAVDQQDVKTLRGSGPAGQYETHWVRHDPPAAVRAR
jgi:hypothetical protein